MRTTYFYFLVFFVFNSWLLPAADSLNVSILCGGTLKDPNMSSKAWAATATETFSSRLRHLRINLSIAFHKTDSSLVKAVLAEEEKMRKVFLLDERGEQLDSKGFASSLYSALEQNGSSVTFVIGAADGLPLELRQPKPKPKLKQNSPPYLRSYLSLGKLTLPHHLARVVLVEQIYRSAEINKGSGYHKD